ncbi:hypothetical protein [Isoalcanivorax pacificus]|uniref:hypothetical protein n=1 Tax=Isoalcanivorax pacificus TaxID=1306787 RepID=UPI0011849CC7|nr:hypothetical protein [Isoalcanivorax pacificus]
MKIQEQDFYHGAALTQIAEHPSFKALNKGSSRYGHYLVNADCHIFIKYSRSSGPWSFTFTSDQLEPLCNVQNSQADLFVCLVCGEETICVLNKEQLEVVIDMALTDSQWIRVEVPPGGRCRVSGSKGKLGKTVPHNTFPSCLFD